MVAEWLYYRSHFPAQLTRACNRNGTLILKIYSKHFSHTISFIHSILFAIVAHFIVHISSLCVYSTTKSFYHNALEQQSLFPKNISKLLAIKTILNNNSDSKNIKQKLCISFYVTLYKIMLIVCQTKHENAIRLQW